MSRYTGPKAKIARRFALNIFGTEKYNKILGKKNYPPGMHGKGRFRKPSEYGKQLIEKQKARATFGINERQFQNYYKKAASQKKIATDIYLMMLLELRLDNAVYRAGFATTRNQARQFVSHGLFLLNGRRVTSPSTQVRIGDAFEIRPRSKNSPIFTEILEQKPPQVPSWLKVDYKTLKGEVVGTPEEVDFEKLVQPQLIVEYYSK